MKMRRKEAFELLECKLKNHTLNGYLEAALCNLVECND